MYLVCVVFIPFILGTTLVRSTGSYERLCRHRTHVIIIIIIIIIMYRLPMDPQKRKQYSPVSDLSNPRSQTLACFSYPVRAPSQQILTDAKKERHSLSGFF